VLIAVMFAELFHSLYGPRFEIFNTPPSAIQFFVQYVITGKGDKNVIDLLPVSPRLPSWVQAAHHNMNVNHHHHAAPTDIHRVSICSNVARFRPDNVVRSQQRSDIEKTDQ
jgi:hypothetical protein